MRNESGQILRAVAAGESVLVTNHGQVAAVISPPPGDVLTDLLARGQARAARRSLRELASLRRRTASRSSGDLVADARGRW
jgi:antitoxin (DNA-binding transcriptional repressor) of toxin-antitoxin stability system